MLWVRKRGAWHQIDCPRLRHEMDSLPRRAMQGTCQPLVLRLPTTPHTARATPTKRLGQLPSSSNDAYVFLVSVLNSSFCFVLFALCVLCDASTMRLITVTAAVLLASVSNASSLTPPVLPLIVRNPYLSTWLQNAREEPWTKWPMFWTGAEVCSSHMSRSLYNTPASSQMHTY